MKKLFIALLITFTSFLALPLHTSPHDIDFTDYSPPKIELTEQEVYRTIFKALNTLAKKKPNIEKINRLLLFTQNDLASLESQWSWFEQKLAAAHKHKNQEQIFALQNKQASLEEQIDDVEAIIMQLEQEKDAILNPPPPPPPIIKEPEPTQPEPTQTEPTQPEPTQTELSQPELSKKEPAFTFSRRTAKTTNKRRSAPLQRRQPKISIQQPSKPLTLNPLEVRHFISLVQNKSTHASLRRTPRIEEPEQNTPEQTIVSR